MTDLTPDEQRIYLRQFVAGAAMGLAAYRMRQLFETMYGVLMPVLNETMVNAQAFYDVIEPLERALFSEWLIKRGVPNVVVGWIACITPRKWIPDLDWSSIGKNDD